jgi:hypothetical protein
VLRFPIFVGTFTTEGTEALLKLRDRLPASLKRFIADFHDGLKEEVAADPRFELRLRVVLEQVQRGDDVLAIQFTRWDDMTAEERELVTELGRRGAGDHPGAEAAGGRPRVAQAKRGCTEGGGRHTVSVHESSFPTSVAD